MGLLPTLAQVKVSVHVMGTAGPFETRIMGQRGRKLLIAVPVGRAPAGAWAKAGCEAQISVVDESEGQARPFPAVVRERRLKPIPLLVVEAQGDVPLALHTGGSLAKVGATVIGVTSGKGGTGKTTFSTNLAWHAASLGYRTLLVDADIGSANCHIHFALRPRAHVGSIMDGTATVADVAVPVTSRLSLLPGISGNQGDVDPSPWAYSRLVTAIDDLQATWDVIIVDTGAGVHMGVTNLLLMVKHLVLVSGNDPASHLGAHSLLTRLSGDGALRRVGVVINRVAQGDGLERAFATFSAGAGRFRGAQLFPLGVIPDDPHVLESLSAGRPVIAALPRSPAAVAYRRTCHTLTAHFEPLAQHPARSTQSPLTHRYGY